MQKLTRISIVGLFVFGIIKISAQPAALDASFANNGIGTYSIPPQNSLSATNFSMQQASGKIIMGISMGGFTGLARLNLNGSLDNNFGADGKILYTANSFARFKDGLIQPDGKIVVTGYAGINTIVVRFNANGSLDNSFDGDGTAIISFTLSSEGRGIAIQADGKIVVAGYVRDHPKNFYTAIRLNVNGSLDNTFDGDGKKQFSLTDNLDDIASAVFIKENGRILIAGTSYNGSKNDMSVARLKTDGSFDETFDGDGKLLVTVQHAAFDYAVSVASYSDGKIILGGSTGNDGFNDFALVKLNSNGSPDNTFDGDGRLIIPVGTDDDMASEMVLQPDGKILLAGSTYTDINSYEFSVIRVNAGGTLDNTFNTTGKRIISFSDNTDFCECISLLVSGKIFLGGATGNPATRLITSYQNYSAAQLNTDGSLDNTFDNDGKAIFENGSYDDVCNAMTVDASGNIVLAGRSIITSQSAKASALRIQPTGAFDNSFDIDGRAYAGGGEFLEANAVITQPNGKILFAGGAIAADTSFGISRLNNDGSADITLDGDGTVIIPVAGTSVAKSIARQSDGKIIVAGYSTGVGGFKIMTVMRITSTGVLDNTFDGDGIKTIPFELSYSNIAYATLVQPDGKILIAGVSQSTVKTIGNNFAVVRLGPDGIPDKSFGTSGKTTIDIAGNDFCYSMKLQADGKIILAGSSISGTTADFAIVRLTASGVLDNSFSADGKKTIDMASTYDIGKSIALQADGKIIFAGYSSNGTDNNAAVIRLNSNGNLDATFDADGKVVFNIAGTDEMINAVAIQNDGKILLAGKQKTLIEAYGSNMLVMRLMGGSSPNIAGKTVSGDAAFQQLTKINADATLSIKQNIPNPFSHTTIINYLLPPQYSPAKIIITDESGKTFKEINISGAGKGSLEVDASTLAGGTYNYSLYVNGRLVDTKRMEHIK
jgi:uncharacterized delta-60 repeat protein